MKWAASGWASRVAGGWSCWTATWGPTGWTSRRWCRRRSGDRAARRGLLLPSFPPPPDLIRHTLFHTTGEHAMLPARPPLFAAAVVLAFGLAAGAQDKKAPATIKILIPETPTKVALKVEGKDLEANDK